MKQLAETGCESGAALISVLLVVFLASLLAASMMAKQLLVMQYAINQREQAQAFQYALGGEELARQLLHNDKLTTVVDHTEESWAVPLPTFSFPNGQVEVRIHDLQGLFNLNALAASGPAGLLAEQRFRRLVSLLELEPSLVDRLADYVDPDTDTRPDGAEDFEYLVQQPPYRTANSLLAHPSELAWLLDMEAETLASLRPWVTVLPDPGTPININTASALLLQAILPELTRPQAEALVQRRLSQEGFESLDDFSGQPGVNVGNLSSGSLSIGSAYYEVSVEARYNDRVSRLRSIIQRNPETGELRVVSRDLGQMFMPADQSHNSSVSGWKTGSLK